MRKRLTGGLCFALVIGSVCRSQPSGGEILKKVDANLSGVQDYTVNLDVTADIERMNVPPMHVKMYFKKPDKFHFDSKGFALLPREGLAFSPQKTLSRYSVEEVNEDTLMQASQFRLLLKPKDDRVRVTKIVLYVDQHEWTPTRIVSSLFGGQTVTATFEYEKQGAFWMPSMLRVEFSTSAPPDTSDQSQEPDVTPMQRPRMPRKGTVTIRYSHYEINTDLGDEIFDKK